MREMSDRTCSFVQEQFREYYSNCFEEIGIKSGLKQREFAALLMQNRMMVRHKSFRSRYELQDFLCSMTPSDMYYSSAYYEQPDAPDMGSKGWVGADLIFDIDADTFLHHATKYMTNGHASIADSPGEENSRKNALLATGRNSTKTHGHAKNASHLPKEKQKSY